MSGYGRQKIYEKVREAAEAGQAPDESRRPKGPTPAELEDELLAECRRTHLAFKASRPRDWGLLHERNAAWAKAEEAGRSLRAIARAAGVTHPTVADQIWKHRNPGWREPEPYDWP